MTEDPKAESRQGASWWKSVPGILTGLAALVTAIAGLITVLSQNDLLERRTKSETPEANILSTKEAETAVSSVPGHTSRVTLPEANVLEVQAGHFLFEILDLAVSPYALNSKGKPAKLTVRLALRISDVVGRSDYVDRLTVRLLAAGSTYLPENSLNVAVYEKQSVETEAVFIIPADANNIELLVGRDGDATAKLPIPVRTS